MLFPLAIGLTGGCYPASLGAAGATLAMDYCQTRDNASVGWKRPGVPKYGEGNPMLGVTPTPRQVDAYFVGVAVLMAAAQLMPQKYATAANWIVAGAETVVVVNNVLVSPGACGMYPL